MKYILLLSAYNMHITVITFIIRLINFRLHTTAILMIKSVENDKIAKRISFDNL